MTEREKLHIFVLYVENQPGVLNRIASLFRRRAYNIESLDRRPHRAPRHFAHDHRRGNQRRRRASRGSQYLQAGERALGRGCHAHFHHRAQPGADQSAKPPKIRGTA